MQAAHDTHARKKTTTLSINADLLSKARSMNINLSANPESPPPMFEQALRNIDNDLHNEAGCTTELDYTEQASWLLFLR